MSEERTLLTAFCANQQGAGQGEYKCALPVPARRLTMVTTLDVFSPARSLG